MHREWTLQPTNAAYHEISKAGMGSKCTDPEVTSPSSSSDLSLKGANVQYTNGNAAIVTDSPFAAMAHDQSPFIVPQVPASVSAHYSPLHLAEV